MGQVSGFLPREETQVSQQVPHQAEFKILLRTSLFIPQGLIGFLSPG